MRIYFALLFLAALASCNNPQGDRLFYGALNLGEPKIISLSGLAGSYAVVAYNTDGQLISTLSDLVEDNLSPRGIVIDDFLNVLVGLDGTDSIRRFSLLGGQSTFTASAQLNGNIYMMAKASNGDVFVIETNVIESFSSSAERIGNPRINTTISSCVLSSPRGMTITQSGYLAVVNTGNDDINLYDISDPGNTTCVTANTTLGNVDPIDILAHSDGYLYVATQGNDSIYRFNGDLSGSGTVIYNNTTVINNPTAMVELPDRTILVASDATNNIVRMDTSGNILNNPLIYDTYTGQVNQLILMNGASQ